MFYIFSNLVSAIFTIVMYKKAEVEGKNRLN
jgi:hypothetical protein